LVPVWAVLTSVAFSGDRLVRLFVTTARLELTGDRLKEAPLSGGFFMIDAGVAGLPEVPYRN